MKKLISTLMALSLTLTSMMTLSSNASIYIYDSDKNDNIPEGYSPIDADIARRYFQCWNGVEKYERFYTNEDATHLIASRQLSSIVVFNLADGASAKDVRDAVWAYCRENETDLKYTAEKEFYTVLLKRTTNMKYTHTDTEALANRNTAFKLTTQETFVRFSKRKILYRALNTLTEIKKCISMLYTTTIR